MNTAGWTTSAGSGPVPFLGGLVLAGFGIGLSGAVGTAVGALLRAPKTPPTPD